MRARSLPLLALSVLAATATLTAPARAGLILTLINGATTVSVPDNTPGLDTAAAVGKINYLGAVGDFSATIIVGTSNSPGTLARSRLQITAIDIINTSNHLSTLDIILSDDDFNAPPAGWPLRLYSSMAGTFLGSAAGDHITFQSYADPSNTLLQDIVPTGTAISPGLRDFTSPGGDELFSFEVPDANTPFTYATPAYSLSDVTTATLAPASEANLSGTTSVVPVPEPASLALLALASTTLLRRRRR